MENVGRWMKNNPHRSLRSWMAIRRKNVFLYELHFSYAIILLFNVCLPNIKLRRPSLKLKVNDDATKLNLVLED